MQAAVAAELRKYDAFRAFKAGGDARAP